MPNFEVSSTVTQALTLYYRLWELKKGQNTNGLEVRCRKGVQSDVRYYLIFMIYTFEFCVNYYDP